MKRIYMLPIIAAGMLAMLTGCAAQGPSKVEQSRQAGIDLMNNGQYSEALESFEEAFASCDEKMPNTKTDILLFEAACLLKMDDYENLIPKCSEVLELQESGDAYYMRGTALLSLGEEEKAAEDFDRASELNKNDYQMFLNIYRQYEMISQSAIGDKYIQKALAIPNNTMDDYYQKGYIYFYLGEYAEALDELAVPVENKEEDAMILMGQAYLSLDDGVRARNIFQQYLENYKGNPKAYNGLALCDITDKAYDTALEDIGKGLAADPDDSTRRELLYNEIVAYEMKLDFETAKVKSESFVENYPDDEEGKREHDFLSTR